MTGADINSNKYVDKVGGCVRPSELGIRGVSEVDIPSAKTMITSVGCTWLS